MKEKDEDEDGVKECDNWHNTENDSLPVGTCDGHSNSHIHHDEDEHARLTETTPSPHIYTETIASPDARQ